MLVRADGSTFCNGFGNNCDLQASGNATGTVTYSTQGIGQLAGPSANGEVARERGRDPDPGQGLDGRSEPRELRPRP